MRNKRMAAAIAALPFMGAVSVAQPDQCIDIQNDLDRLACYDREVGRTPTVEPIVEGEHAWSVRSETSEMTDDTNVYMAVRSEDPPQCRFGNQDAVMLMIRCLENRTSIFFHTGCHMTDSSYSNYGDVDIRLDDDPAETVSMNSTTTNDALIVSSGRAIKLAKKMFGKKRLLARMMPYGESPMTTRFDISGTEEAIEPLRETCGW